MQDRATREAAPQSELRLAIEEALARAEAPVSAAALRRALPKPFRRTAPEIAAALKELAIAGSAHAIGAGKSVRYLGRDPAPVVGAAVRAALAGGPATQKTIEQSVRREAPGLEKLAAGVLGSLAAHGVVYPHPKIGKQPLRHGLEPPDPAPYLVAALREVKKTLTRLGASGVTPAAVHAALGRALGVTAEARAIGGRTQRGGTSEDQAAVLAGARALAAREPPGGLLSIRTLRGATPLDKPRFDGAVLALSRSGAVVLHHHDFPSSLAPEERARLVEDEDGTHYIGLALRRAP